jgi:hypothetical protein
VSECEFAFTNHPVSCFIAVKDGAMIGFACYDVTCKNFFGQTGVAEDERKKRAGKGLLLACLYAMRANGYGYAVIGVPDRRTIMPEPWVRPSSRDRHPVYIEGCSVVKPESQRCGSFYFT